MPLYREWIGLVLVLVGLLRAGVLVSHDPLMGYANQYDMVRTSACLGLYPSVKDPTVASPEAPIALYKTGGDRSRQCYLSSEVALVATVVAASHTLGNDGSNVRLQWIGWAKLGILAITALLLAWAFHRHPAASLVHGLVVALVMTDPVVTLWFNSLYTEFAVMWALYAGVGAILALAITDRGAFALTALLVSALLTLAFSREQFALLGAVFAVLSWPWLWQRSPHLAVSAFGVALVASLISFALVPRPGAVKHVNRADTYLGVVLPAASDPQRALGVLGLPERCGAMVGATWYLQRGDNVQQTCPEVFSLSSFAFLRFAADEPQLLARAVARVLPTAQAISPAYLGTLEGTKNTGAGALPWWARSPLLALATHLQGKVFIALLAVALVLGPLSLLAALAWAQPSRVEHGAALLYAMLLTATVGYSLVTTVFGDGLSESGRHFLPGALAFFALFISLIVAIPHAILRWKSAPKQRAFEMVGAVAGTAVLVAALVVAMRWAEAQPLALGVLDSPSGRQGNPAGTQLRGWALDPFGVDSVQVELGKLRRPARHGDASPDIAAAFPGYPANGEARFALDLSPEDLAQAGAPGALPLRITVRNGNGAVTEIDKRVLEFAP